MSSDTDSTYSEQDIGLISLFGDPLTASSASSFHSSPRRLSLVSPDSCVDGKDREERKQEENTAFPNSFPATPKHEVLAKTAPQDAATPDHWIKRNPDLIRLTGKHPFNCEAPLSKLFDAGFLTPPHLFYVRNHGAVPQVDQQAATDWTLKIHGLVKNEFVLTLDDLTRFFPVVTLPVTLVCAGNRRKEQNMVSQSLGFSWGAAGLSTALFTGVFLADILAVAKPVRGEAKHVIFEGTEHLPNGHYGTSQRLSWAADRSKGMLISWAMNGAPLEPDHGYPLRVVIPGQIGGRSVKWLNRIEVSDRESQHHLHFWDNKVLPTQVTAEEARSTPSWWYDPKYIINELNINSAIARPDHNETISLTHSNSFNSFVDDTVRTYKLAGYAYAGGGRRVNRVEISLDGGKEWRLAEITYPEDRFRQETYSDRKFGTLDLTDSDACFCWCFWSYTVSFLDIESSSVIMVRAMDESLVLQQKDIYWNATGMMNNWWFRVAVHRFEEDGQVKIRFEHPTLAGTNPGGWMERLKAAGRDLRHPSFDNKSSGNAAISIENAPPPSLEVSMTKEGVKRVITWDEIRAQDPAKPWFVVNGNVYDGTGFLKDHPGGPDSILLAASEDATEDFMAIHSMEGRGKLAEFHIGILDNSDSATAVSTLEPPAPVQEVDSDTFLHKKLWKSVKLISRTIISRDTIIFRFTLPNLLQKLGLPPGQHVFVRASTKDGEAGMLVQRAYTPVSDSWQTGYIDMLIKLYRPCEAFPLGGKMSTLFDMLEIGHEVQLKGPLGSFIWLGKGEASWRGKLYKPGVLAMICGGSGITPILQVLRAVLHDQEDLTTRIYVLTSNKREDDILCREELDTYRSSQPADRYQIHHLLTRVPDSDTNWKGGIGRITNQTLVDHLPIPSEEALVLTCGPDGMIETVKGCLSAVGWNIEKSLVVF